MLWLSPWLMAMKMGLLSKQKGKELLLRHFFHNTDVAKFNTGCNVFAQKIIPSLIRKDAMQKILQFKGSGITVVVVSASAENWVAPWCNGQQILFLTTQLEIKEEKITGNILGTNCNGAEKVNRIKQAFDLAEYKNIYCFGDTGGDKEMLALATHPHYRVFKN